MSEPALERHARFVHEFLAPLFAGGACRVGAPIPAAYRDAFVAASIPSEEDEAAVLAGLARAAEALLGAPVRALPLPEGAMALAMAAHDLAAAVDPLLDRAFARRAVPALVRYAKALASDAGPPSTRWDALARHALLERVLAAPREDVVVRNWAATYRFHGRPVPWNVTTLPAIRRVRTTSTRRPLRALLHEGASIPGLTEAVRAVLAASPLTALAEDAPFGPLALDEGLGRVLADPVLGRLAVRTLATPRHLGRVGRLAEALAPSTPGALARPALARLADATAVVLLDGPTRRELASRGEAVAIAFLADSLARPGSLAEGLVPRDRMRLGAIVAALEHACPEAARAHARALADTFERGASLPP